MVAFLGVQTASSCSQCYWVACPERDPHCSLELKVAHQTPHQLSLQEAFPVHMKVDFAADAAQLSLVAIACSAAAVAAVELEPSVVASHH